MSAAITPPADKALQAFILAQLDLHPRHAENKQRSRACRGGVSEMSTFRSIEAPSTAVSRPKRNQVGRACDWCRLNRIKCDDNQPCKNCQTRGGECVFRRKDPHNMSSANREIERLRVRVAELENQIKTQKDAYQSSAQGHAETRLDQSLKIHDWGSGRSKRRHWEGIWTAESHTAQAQYYGQSSYFYFLNEIRSHLKDVLQREYLDFPSLPNAPSRIFASPTSASPRDDFVRSSGLGEEKVSGEDLKRPQEEYFLTMFWQLYYCTVPILDHGSFKKLYDSLWAHSRPQHPYRKSSALVDIVLALSIQYATASMPPGQEANDIDDEDSSIGGRWFYRRCQMLLSSERERPTLSTMQCYIYSAVYLWNASFFNLAHETIAVALRAAHALGLHQKSHNHLPEGERHLFQQIWWTLFCLDTKACIDLGRPFSIFASDVTGELASDNPGDAVILESRLLLSHEGLNHLEYHSQCVKLLLVAQNIHIAFHNKCTELLTNTEGDSPRDDPTAHETAAKFLDEGTKLLQQWTRKVPELLKTSRKGKAEPFSVSRSTLEVETYIPIWLQRQRIFLELLYHNITMTLYRPFIQSSSSPMYLTPIADGCRHKCLHHAIVTTNIIHQLLTETTLLNGMYQVYQYQWEAIISLLGFALFRPICPFASSINNAIQTGITALDIFGTNNFRTALSAANAARNLSEHIEIYRKNFQTSLATSYRTPNVSVDTPQDISVDPSLHLLDIPAMYDQTNASLSPTRPDSQTATMMSYPRPKTAPATVEEFAARMAAELHSDSSLWLMDQNFNSGILDTNMEIWANLTNDS